MSKNQKTIALFWLSEESGQKGEKRWRTMRQPTLLLMLNKKEIA